MLSEFVAGEHQAQVPRVDEERVAAGVDATACRQDPGLCDFADRHKQ